MKVKFIADYIIYEINDENNYYMIAFSDNRDDPEEYVIVQRAINFDKQDIELGIDSNYFEYLSESNSAYGNCKNVLVEENRVVFELEDKDFSDIESIEVLFDKEKLISDYGKFEMIFKKIFP